MARNLVPLKPEETEALPKIYGMLLEGNTRQDIEAAAPKLFPGCDVKKVVDHALAAFATVANESTDVIGGWCLQKGKAVQIGSPMDVYSNPSNSYAAMLFGKTNLLHRELIPCAPYSFLDEDSGKELVSIRPHQWMVSTSTGNENMPRFEGAIRSVNPKGPHQEIVMETEKTLLTIHFPRVFSAAIGDTLTVVFNKDS